MNYRGPGFLAVVSPSPHNPVNNLRHTWKTDKENKLADRKGGAKSSKRPQERLALYKSFYTLRLDILSQKHTVEGFNAGAVILSAAKCCLPKPLQSCLAKMLLNSILCTQKAYSRCTDKLGIRATTKNANYLCLILQVVTLYMTRFQ